MIRIDPVAGFTHNPREIPPLTETSTVVASDRSLPSSQAVGVVIIDFAACPKT